MTIALTGGVRHPKIYAYTFGAYASTPWQGGREGTGLIKVGETQRDVARRVREQIAAVKMPSETIPDILLVEAAVTDDGRVFTDKEVHHLLSKAGYHNVAGEWFECTKDEVLAAIQAVRRGEDLPSVSPINDFPMRPEQVAAVQQTAAYFRAHPKTTGGKTPDFLWNAKMRFGKTFTTYQLAREMGWTRLLVLTYKPAVEKSWRDDLAHKDFAGWRFHSRDDDPVDIHDEAPLVWFASFQDVLGTDAAGKTKEKNRDLFKIDWDAVIIDEYHFGAWREAARSVYAGEIIDETTGDKTEGDKSETEVADTPDLEEDFVEGIETALDESLSVGHYLYLSGTPFRALTEGEFLEDQVYNWTYSDEQRAKREWVGEPNPYASLPKMHLLAYEMPDVLKEVAENNASEFSLTEFFRTTREDKEPPVFIHENEVQRWLDLLRGQDLTELWKAVSAKHRPPMPFSDVNLLTSLQHTLWYLPSVNACIAMRDLLEQSHNKFFRDYTIIVAAGSEVGMGQQALVPVEEAITRIPQDSKTITLTCGKLTTGVTVPAWAGIFMLRELKSPETYFQAAFRVQSPWAYKRVNTIEGGQDEVVVKEHCYVLDFSPNRALRLVVDYATKLSTSTVSRSDAEAALDEFTEFMPILAFDGSTMSKVSAAGVIDYLTKGISSSMLARRWNSPELITLDVKAMEAILADAELVDSLEAIEMFRTISDDLTALISSNKELKPKKLAKEKLTQPEKKRDNEDKKKRKGIKDKLQRFLTRIPAFMYLTDHREKTVFDIITQVEPDLFQKVTSLSLKDFERLVEAGVFNAPKMNDAVWKFREFEAPSLSYTRVRPSDELVGGWNVQRDTRFADLIESGIAEVGTALIPTEDVDLEMNAAITSDFGIVIGGIRYVTPDEAARAVCEDEAVDGWEFWSVATDDGRRSLADLEESLSRP
jgi:hypothetical protein